jgi:3-hydroxybutyryl-CoA dehydrogenase
MQTQNVMKKIVVAGCGKMGRSIFNFLSCFDFELVWLCRDEAEKEYSGFEKKLARRLKNSMINQNEFYRKLDQVSVTDDISKLSGCGLLIESISEDLQKKNDFFASVQNVISSDAIVVSNSSSIIPSAYDVPEQMRSRLAGMHFFYPVETNSLLEVVSTVYLKPEYLKILMDFAEKTGKFPLLQNQSTAFACNRFFLEIQSSLFNFCMEKKVPFAFADKVIKKHFFPAGIFEVMEHIGLKVLVPAVSNYILMHDEPSRIQPLLDFLIHVKKNADVIFTEPFPDGCQGNLIQEEEVISFVNGVFRKFAEKYIRNSMFSKEELTMMMKEITLSDYFPLNE